MAHVLGGVQGVGKVAVVGAAVPVHKQWGKPGNNAFLQMARSTETN